MESKTIYSEPPRAVNKLDAEGTHNAHKGANTVRKKGKPNEYDMKQLRVLRRALEYLDEHGTSVQAYSVYILVLAPNHELIACFFFPNSVSEEST